MKQLLVLIGSVCVVGWASKGAGAELEFGYADPDRQLNIVAHQDDDLGAINPVIAATLSKGREVRTVFLTAGDANWECQRYIEKREEGIENAYVQMAEMAGYATQGWRITTPSYAGHQVAQYELVGAPVSLVFMRLRNPVGPFFSAEGLDSANSSAAHGGDLGDLWHSVVPSIKTLEVNVEEGATGVITYTRSELIATLAAIVDDFNPNHVNLLDGTELADFDSSDHVHSALFGLAALQEWGGEATVRMHQVYGAATRPRNLSESEASIKVSVFNTYVEEDFLIQPDLSGVFCRSRLAHDEDYADSGCPDTFDREGTTPLVCQPYNILYAPTEHVTYAIGAVQHGTGRISTPGELCLTADGSGVVRSDVCGSTSSVDDQRWTFTRRRTIENPGGQCLRDSGDGVVLGGCDGIEAQFVLFDTGQLRGPGATCAQVDGGVGAPIMLADCDVDQGSAQLGFGLMFGAPAQAAQAPDFSLAQVSGSVSQYSTIALADVTGDGVSEACARRSGGVFCANEVGSIDPQTSDFGNGGGWGIADYGSTVQFANIDGVPGLDVCGRGAMGVRCALATGSGFTASYLATTGGAFSDLLGYGAGPSYYRSLKLVDVDGDTLADVCARNARGIECALNDGSGMFGRPSQWTTEFSDAKGWGVENSGATIMFGDVNGDGKNDVCGRGVQGIRCALNDGTGFVLESLWGEGDFRNGSGWALDEASWGSLRLIDVDGSGTADVCARGAAGRLQCHLSWGGGFGRNVVHVTAPGFTDEAGWGAPMFGATLTFDATSTLGVQRVCARGPIPGTSSPWLGPSTGLMCAER